MVGRRDVGGNEKKVVRGLGLIEGGEREGEVVKWKMR